MQLFSKKQATDFLLYLLFRALVLGLKLLPFGLRKKALEFLMGSLFYTARHYRRLVFKNLRRAFPHQDRQWLIETAKKNFAYLGLFLAEFLQQEKITTLTRQGKVYFADGREENLKAVQDGAIIIAGHLGNWEWHGASIAHLRPGSVYTLARQQSNRYVNRFIEKMRAAENISIIYSHEKPVKIIRLLKKKQVVGFIADQSAADSGEYFPFFGRLASTFMGPATFARLSAVPVYFLWSYHDEKKRLVLCAEEIPRPGHIDAENDSHRWEQEFTLRWLRCLEDKIRQHPTEYFWVHNRWKYRPNHNSIVYQPE